MSYVEETLGHVHKEIAPSMGELCMALARRRVSSERVRIWVHALRAGADILERLAVRMEERRHT